jgi:branched-chain amino acid aminotransferase
MPNSVDLVSFNGSLIAASDARIDGLSNAALYGKGIFTTIAIVDGATVFWEKHWRRLNDNAARIGIGLTGESDLLSSIDQLIRRKHLTQGRARVTVFDETRGVLWSSDASQNSAYLVAIAGPRELDPVFRLGVSPFTLNSRSPIAGIKSCNYLEPTIALQEARRAGFNEVVRLNEFAEIASAAMSNSLRRISGSDVWPEQRANLLSRTLM